MTGFTAIYARNPVMPFGSCGHMSIFSRIFYIIIKPELPAFGRNCDIIL